MFKRFGKWLFRNVVMELIMEAMMKKAQEEAMMGEKRGL